MRIVIKNKIHLLQAPDEVKQYFVRYLKVDNPKYQEAVKAGRSTYNIKPIIYNFDLMPNGDLLIPRGCKRRVFNLADHLGIEPDVVDQRTKFDQNFSVDASQINYWPSQKRAILSLTTGGEEGMLVAPPGSGKTVMGISLLALLGQPMLWLTHTRPLAKQAVDRVKFFYPFLRDKDIGFLGNKKWELGDVFTVGIIQTLIRRPDDVLKIMNNFGIVILDEAHHCPARTFLEVVSSFNPYYLYGLTATPYRRDKLEALMFQTLGEETARISVKEVEEEGVVIIPSLRYRYIKSKKIQDNNVQQLLKRLVNNDKRNNIIVADVLREAALGNHCIVLSDRKVHCEKLHKAISEVWDKTGIATGDYSAKKVEEVTGQLTAGNITVLVATSSLLGEGFDVKFLNRAFLTLPFRAEAKAEQLVGRVSRVAPNKTDAIVYDYVDADIGVFYNQFYSRKGPCRYRVYKRLGMDIQPY